jgi:hypothetical protein
MGSVERGGLFLEYLPYVSHKYLANKSIRGWRTSRGRRTKSSSLLLSWTLTDAIWHIDMRIFEDKKNGTYLSLLKEEIITTPTHIKVPERNEQSDPTFYSAAECMTYLMIRNRLRKRAFKGRANSQVFFLCCCCCWGGSKKF